MPDSPLPLSPNGRRYGWLRTLRDHRDFRLSTVPNLKLAAPPPVDLHLAQYLGAVKDQGQLGACTAFTGTEDREAIALQYQGKTAVLSPMFLYYVERMIDGSLSEGDCGSTGQTSCAALQKYGICEEVDLPYDPANFEVAPNAAQLNNAKGFVAGAYHSIFYVEDIKMCINSGYRVRVGMDVYESFEDTGSDGLVAVPDTGKESLLGGHEVLGWGYDDTVKCPGAKTPGAVRFRNSWGASWGLGGDFWLPYEMLAPDSIVQPDVKIQHLGGPWLPK